MRSEEIMGPRLQFVHKFTLYVLPNGELVATMGNQRVTVTQDEAHKWLQFALLVAKEIHLSSIGDVAVMEGVL